MAIKFKSYFDMLFPDKKSQTFIYESNAGKQFMVTYEYDVVDGIKMLVPVGETDLQSSIDSFAESQDINNIIARFVNGDMSVLNPNKGTYGDFTDVPKTYAELFSRVQQCKNVFDKMPVDIRDKFDNSYEKFWSEFGSDRFNTVFDEFNSKFGNQAESGVSESGPVPSGNDTKGVEVDAK